MTSPQPTDASARWITRALGAVAVLVGIIAMHAMTAPAGATPMAHAPMAMTMTSALEDLPGGLRAPSAATQPSSITCGQHHCVATLPTAPRVAAPSPAVAAAPQFPSAPTPSIQPHPANGRAPPHLVCLTTIYVSRT